MPGSGWLVYVYARIAGRGAYPQLAEMLRDAKLSFLIDSIDGAISLSLGLTSFVSSTSQLPADLPLMCRDQQPRDAVDRFLLACIKGDQAALAKSLGPAATAALGAPESKAAWLELLSVTTRHPNGPIVIGYSLSVDGAWSAPLEDLEPPQPADTSRYDLRNPLGIVLRNASGADCGSSRVSLARAAELRFRSLVYVVDDSNLAGLFRVVATCIRGDSPAPTPTTAVPGL
jgi:hypothetical protein